MLSGPGHSAEAIGPPGYRGRAQRTFAGGTAEREPSAADCAPHLPIELADHLRARFDEEKIQLAGLSWGSTLGVLAADRAPDRFHAFTGARPVVFDRRAMLAGSLDLDRRLRRQTTEMRA